MNDNSKENVDSRNSGSQVQTPLSLVKVNKLRSKLNLR